MNNTQKQPQRMEDIDWWDLDSLPLEWDLNPEPIEWCLS